MMNLMTSLSLLPSPLQEPHCPAWESTPFQPVVHLSHAWLQPPAACPLPLTAPSWSDPIPHLGKEAAASFSLRELGGARALGAP